MAPEAGRGARTHPERSGKRERTFQQAFYLETRNPIRRGWRNLRLGAYVLSMVWRWAVIGGRVRRALRRARRSGRVYTIDHLVP